ncbi:MAG: hypothetical protein HFG75_04955 [Hungatella sp.]|nr:hypothetical protein [Hungatella sp.]
MDAIDNLCIYVMVWGVKAREKVKDFLDSQSGVSNVVATIIILLMVVLIISFFWDKLKTWLNDMMDTIFATKFNY